jgi:hypothetical protein
MTKLEWSKFKNFNNNENLNIYVNLCFSAWLTQTNKNISYTSLNDNIASTCSICGNIITICDNKYIVHTHFMNMRILLCNICNI